MTALSGDGVVFTTPTISKLSSFDPYTETILEKVFSPNGNEVYRTSISRDGFGIDGLHYFVFGKPFDSVTLRPRYGWGPDFSQFMVITDNTTNDGDIAFCAAVQHANGSWYALNCQAALNWNFNTNELTIDPTFIDQGIVNIGNGTNGIDYILRFRGNAFDGTIQWTEDENYFTTSALNTTTVTVSGQFTDTSLTANQLLRADSSGNIVSTDSISIGELVRKSSTPTTLNGNTNNWNFGNYSVVRASASAEINITGFTGGSNGRTFALINVSTNTITIKNQDSNSSAENRVLMNGDLSVTANESYSFWYDDIDSRWRIIY